MADHRNVLKKKFDEIHRYNNFGNVIMRIHVQGFRCHSNTVIDIKSPITAFCGLNGVGKSTLIQLAASAYRAGQQNNTYYISDFISIHKFDPAPFTDEASVVYQYWQQDRSLKKSTLSRAASEQKWTGYRARPERSTFFVGIGSYLPRVEKSDFTTRYPQEIKLISSDPVEKHIKEWTCRILGHNYEEIVLHTFNFRKRTDKISAVQYSGVSYSEPHMGYGEARSQYLVRILEGLPNKSLVLIEEPEISLHSSAQYQFGCYLVDVSTRKGHQILLTTHSEFLLKALSSQSIIYLDKTPTGIRVLEGLTPIQAQSLMAQGHVKALHILVEDSCAESILSEILRRTDPDFLRYVEIYPAGDYNTISKTVRTLATTGLSVAAVLDGDQGHTPDDNIFKLPGDKPPEKELFTSESVKNYIQVTYATNLGDFMVSFGGTDHHQWLKKLAESVKTDEAFLRTELARIYVKSLPENSISFLTTGLKEASRKKWNPLNA
jgi:predicted ATPase